MRPNLKNPGSLTRPDGSILGQQVLPVDSVGLYVPGGQGGNTPLVSSLLMNAIPAQVAGVPRLAVCTPPRKDGSVNPHILAAAHLLDIDEVYRVGGAWAVGALACGTQSISPVDVIAGPGNIYVTTAKRLVQGTVGIDMIAGPSEVLILADASANPAWLAADCFQRPCMTFGLGHPESRTTPVWPKVFNANWKASAWRCPELKPRRVRSWTGAPS